MDNHIESGPKYMWLDNLHSEKNNVNRRDYRYDADSIFCRVHNYVRKI